MSDKLPDSNQNHNVARLGKWERSVKFNRRSHFRSSFLGLLQREKSPNPRNENTERAQLAGNVQASAVTPTVRHDGNEETKPDITKELYPEVKQDHESKESKLEMKTTATNSSKDDDMWMMAETQLRKDQAMSKILDTYYDILNSKIGAKLERVGTTNRQQQICNFIDSESNTLHSSGFRGQTKCAFDQAFKYVLAAKDIINTAAAPCLPASVACAGVMLLLSVSWSL